MCRTWARIRENRLRKFKIMEHLFNIDLDKISSSSEKEAFDRKKTQNYSMKMAYQTRKTKIGNLPI